MHSPIKKKKRKKKKRQKDKHHRRSKCFLLGHFNYVQAKTMAGSRTFQKVFRWVKLSFTALISILLLLLQAAVQRSAGKPLAMRFVVEPDKHQLPE